MGRGDKREVQNAVNKVNAALKGKVRMVNESVQIRSYLVLRCSESRTTVVIEKNCNYKINVDSV